MLKTAIAICLLLSVCTPAGAVTIDFSTVLLDIEGEAVKEGDKPVTLGTAATRALLNQFADEQTLAPEEKVKRFLLATKISGKDKVDLTFEEIATVRKLMCRAFNTLVCGRAAELLPDK